MWDTLILLEESFGSFFLKPSVVLIGFHLTPTISPASWESSNASHASSCWRLGKPTSAVDLRSHDFGCTPISWFLMLISALSTIIWKGLLWAKKHYSKHTLKFCCAARIVRNNIWPTPVSQVKKLYMLQSNLGHCCLRYLTQNMVGWWCLGLPVT
jgi:hypothetical protein